MENNKELTPEQFELIATLIRSREPVRSAAYLVLVDGLENRQAIAGKGISDQSISNTVRRFRDVHKMIHKAYITT